MIKKGDEPGDFFLTPDDAALDFALFYNDNSIRNNIEYASTIFTVQNDDGVYGFTYTLPNICSESKSIASEAPLGHKAVATIHTHGSAVSVSGKIYRNNEFSGSTYFRNGDYKMVQNLRSVNKKGTDIYQANYMELDSYLATPNGSLLKYDYSEGKISTISTKIPSDKQDKSRKNNIDISERNPITATRLAKINDKILHLSLNTQFKFK